MILSSIKESLESEEILSAYPTPCVPPNRNLVLWAPKILKLLSFIIQLNIFDCTSIIITPLHLLGSGKSPDFGTRTHWFLRQLSKSTSLLQNSVMKSNTYLLQSLSMALNVSGGTPSNTGAVWFFNLSKSLQFVQKVRLNSSQVIRESRSWIVWHCLISSKYTKINWGVIVVELLKVRVHYSHVILAILR